MSIEQAKSFLKTIKESAVYASIGKVGAWNADDSLNPKLVHSPNALEEDFNDAIFFTKTLPNHYSLAAKRYDWADGTVYTQWNQNDFDLASKVFYCVNDTGYVYKCLSNAGESPSTVMPDAVTPERFQTSDGYIWKLIAVVPEPVSILFNSAAYIPVRTLTESVPEYIPQYLSQSAAVRGTLDRIDVVQPGKGYTDKVKVTIVGDGHGATAIANRHAITGEILSISVTDQGVGYTQVTILIEDDSNIPGDGAIAVPILSPAAGHGADPEKELFATTIIGAIQIQGTENGFLEDSFDFRKVCLHSNIVPVAPTKLEVSPRSGLTYVKQADPFKMLFRANVEGASQLRLKFWDNDLLFTVFADPANPYGEDEAYFTQRGITVAYDGTAKTWLFTFDATESAAIFSKDQKITAQVNSETGVPLFGNVDVEGSDNTLRYTFRFDSTVSNEPVNDFAQVEPIDDPMYEYTIKLMLGDISGSFTKGETVTFLNTGSATVVFVGADYIKIASPHTIMTGQIHGTLSGANANVLSIENKRFSASGEIIYRHYFDKRTKLSDQNLKITPIFKF